MSWTIKCLLLRETSSAEYLSFLTCMELQVVKNFIKGVKFSLENAIVIVRTTSNIKKSTYEAYQNGA